jgi:hypothetical protein
VTFGVGRRLRTQILVGVAAAIFATGAFATAAMAHDVPNEIIVRVFVKQHEDQLDVAARVPLILTSQFDLAKRGPGYLDLDRIDPELDRISTAVADTLIPIDEGGEPLSPVSVDHRISLPAENEFSSYEDATRHVRSADLPADANVFWNQGWFDVHYSLPTSGDTADLYLDPTPPSGVGDKMEVLVNYISADGASRAYRLSGDSNPVALDPSWFQAAHTFIESGVEHILGGIDHLLFLLCLVLPMRSLSRLLPVVTSFTVAHSLALFAAAQGLIPSGEWFPPLVEATIAASILYMAIENVIAPDLRRRWIVTGIFGIVHGFGLSYGLQQEFQLAGDHLLTSLFAFNLGVEIGQVMVLALAVGCLALLFRIKTFARFGVVIASVAIGHTGWHWMMDRISVFPSLEWPSIEEATIVGMARAGVVLMIAAAVVYGVERRVRARPRVEAARSAPQQL